MNKNNSTTNTETTTNQEATVPQDRITMYKLAGMLSEATGSRVREQQMYNYRAKGLIKVGADGKVSLEQAQAFVVKFTERRAARANKEQ